MEVIIKMPGKRAEVVDIENTLKALQDAVGGYIETLTVPGGEICLVFNEEGRILDLPYNVTVYGAYELSVDLYGPVLVVGVDGDEFTDVKNAEKIRRKLFDMSGIIQKR